MCSAALVLRAKAPHQDAHGTDLHNAFDRFAEKSRVRHPAAETIGLGLTCRGGRKDNMLGADQCRAGSAHRIIRRFAEHGPKCRGDPRAAVLASPSSSFPRRRLLRPTNVATKALRGWW